MSRHTYGKALIDWTNVQSKILIVSPCRSNLINRAARNNRRNDKLINYLKQFNKMITLETTRILNFVLNAID